MSYTVLGRLPRGFVQTSLDWDRDMIMLEQLKFYHQK